MYDDIYKSRHQWKRIPRRILLADSWINIRQSKSIAPISAAKHVTYGYVTTKNDFRPVEFTLYLRHLMLRTGDQILIMILTRIFSFCNAPDIPPPL